MNQSRILICPSRGYQVTVFACQINKKNGIDRCKICPEGDEAIRLADEMKQASATKLKNLITQGRYQYCSIEGCRRKAKSKGKCLEHYHREWSQKKKATQDNHRNSTGVA